MAMYPIKRKYSIMVEIVKDVKKATKGLSVVVTATLVIKKFIEEISKNKC